ncbi:MAG: nucleoside deaminase [Chloroflexi bacterium]|nr:nucleoside deaminase [Chloroflexota bacterium]
MVQRTTTPEDYELFMRLALDEARKSGNAINRGVGAVVVYQGQVVGRSGYRRERAYDPTAHAEMVAIREAVRVLDRDELSGCTLYTTLEPCPMCCGAVIVSDLSALVVGTLESPEDGRWGHYHADKVLAMAGWDCRNRLATGVLEQECRAVLQESGARRRPSPGTR